MADNKIELAIDANASKAVGELGKAEKAQEGLAKATGKAAKAATDQAKSEGAATLSLDKSTVAAIRAAKSQDDLSASIRREREERKIAAGFAKVLNDAQNKYQADDLKRIRTHRDGKVVLDANKQSLLANVGAAGKFAAGLAGVATASQILTTALSTAIERYSHFQQLANKGSAAGKGLKEFVAAQAPGAEGQQHVQDTVRKGALWGATSDMAAAIATPLQAAADKNSDGKLDKGEKSQFDTDFGGALSLTAQGVAAEDAMTVVLAGRAKDRSGTVSADALTRSAEISKKGTDVFAKSASAWGNYADPTTAMAITTALTDEEFNEGQIPTRVQDIGLALGQSGDSSKFSEKYGLKGMDMEAKIARLREVAASEGKGATEQERIANWTQGDFGQDLDEGKARAVGMIIRQGHTMASTSKELRTMKGGVAEAKVAALRENPLTATTMLQEEARATAEYNSIYGPESNKAREKKARAIEEGAVLQKGGGSFGVDIDSGEAAPWYTPRGYMGRLEAGWNTGRPFFGWDGEQGASSNDRARGALGDLSGGGSGRKPRMGSSEEAGGGDQGARQEMAELKQALRENTEATRQNSSSTKTAKPVGGARSNAEEKY